MDKLKLIASSGSNEINVVLKIADAKALNIMDSKLSSRIEIARDEPVKENVTINYMVVEEDGGYQLELLGTYMQPWSKNYNDVVYDRVKKRILVIPNIGSLFGMLPEGEVIELYGQAILSGSVGDEKIAPNTVTEYSGIEGEIDLDSDLSTVTIRAGVMNLSGAKYNGISNIPTMKTSYGNDGVEIEDTDIPSVLFLELTMGTAVVTDKLPSYIVHPKNIKDYISTLSKRAPKQDKYYIFF